MIFILFFQSDSTDLCFQ